MNKPCIVGIAGGSASGKTTIVNKLKASFGDDILVISHDSYYKAHNDLSYDERTRLNYDHPDSFDTDLMIGDIAKLCDLREFRRSRPTEQTQPLIRNGEKNIVRLQNTEIKNIGEIIDVRILVMKKMPLVLIIPPRAPARGAEGHA